MARFIIGCGGSSWRNKAISGAAKNSVWRPQYRLAASFSIMAAGFRHHRWRYSATLASSASAALRRQQRIGRRSAKMASAASAKRGGSYQRRRQRRRLAALGGSAKAYRESCALAGVLRKLSVSKISAASWRRLPRWRAREAAALAKWRGVRDLLNIAAKRRHRLWRIASLASCGGIVCA
jgi:hypothetical protein